MNEQELEYKAGSEQEMEANHQYPCVQIDELLSEQLIMGINNLLFGESLEESYDWGLVGVLGFKAIRDGESVKVEIKWGEEE